MELDVLPRQEVGRPETQPDAAMDVLHVGCAFHPYRGGSTVRLGTLIAHQPHVRSHIVTHVLEDDGDLHGTSAIYRLNRYYDASAWRMLRQLNRDLRPAAVVLHNPWIMLFWCAAVDPFHRTRRVAEIHNFRDETRLRAGVTGALYRRMDAVVVLSRRARGLVVQRYRVAPEKVFVVRNGVACDPIQAPPRSEDPRVVFSYVGTFAAWQGVQVISRAARLLGPEFFRNAKIVLAGGGDLERQCRDELEDLIRRGDVEWHGWLDKSRADAVLAATDVVLMPRLSTLGTEYVVPLKVFEAMRYGKAVLASDVGGLTENLHHDANAWIVPPADPAALAEGMRRLAENRGLRLRLGAAGQADVRRCETWADSGAAYERIFRSPRTSRGNTP